MKTVGIVLAGGSGRRMGTETEKQYLTLAGYPVLYYSLRAMEESFLDEILVVAAESRIGYCRKEIVERYHFTKVKQIVAGGAERSDSVANALRAIREADYVFIHDGARPCLTAEILNRGLERVKETGACVAGVPSKDTVKIVEEDGRISFTPERGKVWNIQTPQVFAFPVIREAFALLAEHPEEKVTDDAMVVEKMLGRPVYVYEGDYRNLKITTPEDLGSAEVFLKEMR